jgi:hypothetical protein
MVIEDKDGDDMVSRLVSEGHSLETVEYFFANCWTLCRHLFPTYEMAQDWLTRFPDYVHVPILLAPTKDITNDRTEFDAAPEADRVKAVQKAEEMFRAAEQAGKDSAEARANWLRLQHWQSVIVERFHNRDQ